MGGYSVVSEIVRRVVSHVKEVGRPDNLAFDDTKWVRTPRELSEDEVFNMTRAWDKEKKSESPTRIEPMASQIPSVNQIQRKIRYFKEQFKKVNDWNRKQTGGNRKSCPYFEKINEIIGKKDSVTFKHVVSAGNPSPTPPQEDQEQQSEKRDEEKGDGDDEAIKAKGKAAKQTRRERKLKRSPKPSLDDSFNEEEETKRAKKFEKTMENLENQGAKMVDTMQSIVTSMEAAQTQQVQFMGEFMKLFAGMTKQMPNKD
ncbi:hypothetical protein ACROYT_G034056 [Oculina patagonica]